MARDPESVASSLSSALRPFRRPWPLMLAALACTVAGLALSRMGLVAPRLLFLGVGLLMASIAVARRLQTTGWQFLEERVESAGLLAVSAFLALLSYLAMDESWDSGQVFLGAFIIFALLAAFLVLLPRVVRLSAVLVIVVLHFGGILTAVTSVPPRNEPAPWISMQLWTHVYRHYLFFAYLTNAYHFYSPDPGPPTLLWFHVEFDDGSARWIKIPSRNDSPIALHHQRMLAAAESAYNPFMGPPIMNRALIAKWEKRTQQKYELLPGIPHDSAEEIVLRRQRGAQLVKFVDPNDGHEAPLAVLDEPFWGAQYSEPQPQALRLLSSYARHIAHSTSDPSDPHNTVKTVRIYRVVHTLISPRELNEGKDPLDPTTFMPHYMGKYDPEGRLLDPKDPFLFWHVPIVRVPASYPDVKAFQFMPGNQMMGANAQTRPGELTKVIDFVEIHATQSDKLQPETPEK